MLTGSVNILSLGILVATARTRDTVPVNVDAVRRAHSHRARGRDEP